MIPLLTVGAGLLALGIAATFGRELWTVDRNLLLVRTQVFLWKSRHEFVDAVWRLAQVRRTIKGRQSIAWELQLENQTGGLLKTLRSSRDDDVPRLLATLLSKRTGWRLEE